MKLSENLTLEVRFSLKVKVTYRLGEHTIKWYGSKTHKGAEAGVFGPRTKYSEPLGKLNELGRNN